MHTGLPTMSRSLAAAAALLASGLLAGPARASALEVRYLFDLASISGDLGSSYATLAWDRSGRELIVVSISEGAVRVYDGNGMETYRFGAETALTGITSIAVVDGGDLVALAIFEGQPGLIRCDYRGEPKERIAINGLPAEVGAFTPDMVRAANGRIYLADRTNMRAVVVDGAGRFEAAYDLAKIAEVPEEKRLDTGVRGFNVDAQGRILYTVAPLFAAFVVTPDGQARSFGQKGSTPGKFNIVGGIAADEQGRIYVTDTLRSVVQVFDADLQFVRSFGFRGRVPGGLISPFDLVAADGKVFVSQNGARGVSVYRVN